MAYTPINWQNGDTITAEKMNKMDNGWSASSGVVTLINSSVSADTEGVELELSGELSNEIGSEATITWQSVEYYCTCFDDGGYPAYGSSYGDYTTIPFNIFYNNGAWLVATSTAGTYSLKIEVSSTIVEVSADFNMAVSKTTALPLQLVNGVTTKAEIDQAFGKLILFFIEGGYHFITNYNSATGDMGFVPSSQTVRASVSDGFFVVVVE